MSSTLEQDLFTKLGLKGFLKVSKVFKDGTKECIFEEENLIVDGAKKIILAQLSYGSTPGTPLSYAKIGTGGASDISGLVLKTPVSSMTDLYTPVTSVPILKLSENMSVPSITLVANVDNYVGNGLKINEAGFFSSSNIMFNIRTFPFVLKDSSFALNLEWVIRG